MRAAITEGTENFVQRMAALVAGKTLRATHLPGGACWREYHIIEERVCSYHSIWRQRSPLSSGCWEILLGESIVESTWEVVWPESGESHGSHQG